MSFDSVQSLFRVAGCLPIAFVASTLAVRAGETSAPPFADVVVERDTKIPMRDGVRLAMDVYRPARDGRLAEGPFPVILNRTPYNKQRADFVETARYFAQHGYLSVVQDCRGRFGSEGTFVKYMAEPEDGHDTVAQLAKLPGSTGKVGMIGSSYGAHVQAGAAKLRAPGLGALVLHVGGTSNGWDHAVRSNGTFALKQLTWAFRNLEDETRDPVIKAMLARENIADWITRLPWRRGQNPLSHAPEFENYVFEMMTRTDYDEYWQHPAVNWVEHYATTGDVPMLHVSGWYDAYCGSALANYLGLVKQLRSPVRLVMGPWVHGPTEQTFSGEVEFGPAAAIPGFNRAWHRRWYDHFLKALDNGVGQEPAVRLFVMGTGDGRRDAASRLVHGGYWRTATDWPLPETQFTRFFLHADGRLAREAPGPDEPAITYTFDPRHPVPTIGGSMAASEPLWVGGAFDQRERKFDGDPYRGFFGSRPPYLPLKARSDVVVYQTEPLEEDVEIVGPIEVVLHASSNRTDTDFTVKLIDVYPPSGDFPSGFDLNLTDGILRARYRNTPERQELMEPGTVYRFVLRPFGTANRFKRGHRIRLDVSSSNFPQFDVNPNTGEPLGLNRRMVTADNTVHHAAAHASYVVLPIIPRRAGAE